MKLLLFYKKKYLIKIILKNHYIIDFLLTL